MKKVYYFRNPYVYDPWQDEDLRFMSDLGVSIKADAVWIEVDAGPAADKICDYLSDKRRFPEYNAKYGIQFDYKYSKEDVLSSEYCKLGSCDIGGGGYPQPEGDYEKWKSKIYDMSKICMKCGMEIFHVGEFWINKRSKRPFWGFTAWANDVFFATEDLYKELFEPLDIGFRQVKKHPGKVIEGIVQLDIPIIDEDLDLSMHNDFEICPVCGKKKFGGKRLYPYVPLHEHPLPHIYYSKEHFGYGGEAYRWTYFSTELVKKLLDKKLIKHDLLVPCKRNLSEYLKTMDY